MRIYDLQQKEVINVCDCKRLGFVGDVDFNIETGCITALIIPGPAHIWGLLGRDTEYIIPFCLVRQIGADIILVDVKEEDVLAKCKY